MAKKQFSNLNNDYELVFDGNSEVEEVWLPSSNLTTEWFLKATSDVHFV